MGNGKPNVLVASFEAMLAQKFHISAGGLGVVQAGLLKSAGRGEWPVNLYGLGILWKQGYYDQKIGPEGMVVEHTTRHYDFLKNTGAKVEAKVELEINGRKNFAKVWYLPQEVFKTAPWFFLDTDLEENDDLARSITRRLYGGTEETRLAQEIVEGIGGIRAFEALSIPMDLYHGQEGHTLLMAIELLRKNLKSGMTPAEALAATKGQFVFTTHTPEIAGNEAHDIDLMIRMGCFPDIPREMIIALGKNPYDDRFNMTAAALRLARKANAVSKLHLETVKGMWSWMAGEERCPLIYITNGVDSDWQYPEFARASTPEELEQAKAKYEERLIRYNERRTGKLLKPGVLTMVWARRFTDYKRPWLIFMDWHWLERLLWSDRLQLIIAGKPHPYDMHSINTFNDIYRKSLKVPNLAVWAGHEYEQSKILKAGAHLWLQTPRRPREACSTSGMSANKNGALILSSRDGWLGTDESPEEHHFLFGVNQRCSTSGEQDTRDYKDFVRAFLEAEEMFYTDKKQWYSKALKAKQGAEKDFSSDRMLRQYIDSMYLS